MGIKICVITPISHLQVYGNLGEMDMSLAHLVLENGGDNKYAEYYRAQSQKGRFVVLDNGLFELQKQGVGVGIESVIKAMMITKPSEVIAEDVLFSSNDTIESTKNFIKAMKSHGIFGQCQVMGVPQGRTIDEWWKCFEAMLELPINTIGLSKLSVPQSFLGTITEPGCVARARLECTALIEKEIPASWLTLADKQVHLLGGDNWTAWEMKQQTKYNWIRSNDSSCAVWYGKDRLVFNDEGKIDQIITQTPDLENHNPETEALLDETQTYILENIVRWHLATKT